MTKKKVLGLVGASQASRTHDPVISRAPPAKSPDYVHPQIARFYERYGAFYAANPDKLSSDMRDRIESQRPYEGSSQ